MLCPEVFNFPPPKVHTYSKEYKDILIVSQTIRMNNFYKSVIVTCPDELQIPSAVQEKLLDDSDYYKVTNCSLTEFLEQTFIDSFVKNGSFYCTTANKNCIIENCAAITPDGKLTIHLLEYVYQTLGIEGTKRDYGFYEVNIDLKNLKHAKKLKWSLNKIECFDFYIKWEPTNDENICPSSVAKYFSVDRGLYVSTCSLEIKKINSTVNEVPVLKDVDIEEMHEWVGMLAHEVNMEPKENYISSYCQPESDNALKSNKVSLLITKGLFTPSVIEEVCKSLTEYVATRDSNNHWVSCSFQSYDNCPWKWNLSSPRMFQSQDCSCNIFITNSNYIIHSIGQLKYS